MQEDLSRHEAPPASAGGRDERFIHNMIRQCQKDKGMAARLRRADNPATEYQSWELLAAYGIDLERDEQRLPFVTVAAAIAKSKSERNGALPLGAALTACYSDGSNSNQARMRLRRLLACDDLVELCRILRPILSLVNSKVGEPLDYLRLLKQLRGFAFDSHKIKAQWAQEFYRQPVTEAEGEDTCA